MTINSLNDFVQSLPNNLIDVVEKARYLYLELGKRSFYDPEYKYFMFDEEDQYIGYSNKSFSNPNIIICTTLSKQFSKLLSIAGIKNTLVYNKGHYYVEFYDENELCHKADITNDLKNIQFGCKTSYFAPETLENDKLKVMDLALGYISESRGYSDDYWYVVKDILSANKLSSKEKLEIVLENLQRFGDINKPGDTEIFSIYQKFVRYCFADDPAPILFSSYKINRQLRETCSIELVTEEGKKIYYTLDPKTRKFNEKVIERKPNFSGDER